jgi:hypothetical protein
MSHDPKLSEVNWTHVRRVVRHLGVVRGLYALSFVMLFVIATLSAAKAIILKPAVDSFVNGEGTVNGLYLL